MELLPKNHDIDDAAFRASKRIIYVHVPKAGGTSIWEMVSGSFRADQSQICALDSLTDPRSLLYIDPVRWSVEADEYARRISPDLKYLQGHFPATRFLGRLEGFYFTWLRHPYQRALSHYFFWRTLPSEGHYIHDYVISNDLSFDHFIELPLMRNLITRFFPDDSFWKLDFFGFQETFEADWRALSVRLGLPLHEPRLSRVTSYPKELQHYLQCEATFKKFCHLNKEDMDLFWFAKELRDQQIACGERDIC